ncbi:MAG: glycerol-3-phosphate 1-O-acyltransferase PlsY [Candidatus Omnitrophica bacterium]|nr:glycerol-3-phosphate 1-O-acyltransferase PlsY [Candidatus Omnitrophota bacterium]
MLWIIIAATISYLAGSIPTAYIFGRLLKGIDIRKHGSGNVGATNALRILGKKVGFLVLLLDILKGFLPVFLIAIYIAPQIYLMSNETILLIAGICCICGHNWPVFLKFKGGKGIATTLGVLIALAVHIPSLKLILALVTFSWFLVFFILGIVSIASIISAITLPLYVFFFKQSQILILTSIILCIFIIVRHKSNLMRFFRGEEKPLLKTKPKNSS